MSESSMQEGSRQRQARNIRASSGPQEWQTSNVPIAAHWGASGRHREEKKRVAHTVRPFAAHT